MQTITLKDYKIHIGEIWDVFSDFIETTHYTSILVLVDENTKTFCLPVFLQNTDLKNVQVIEILAGEKHKNIKTCQYIWQEMLAKQASRQSLMIQLGGGVVGDMGGFCAGTFKRGIDFVQFPTTLLSQVDSSIGGKLGIDFGEVKNSIGLFKNPESVFIFPGFLKTLPYHEVRSGFAEMIKHSLIADADQWSRQIQLENLEKVDWADFLTDSLKIKKQIVEEDPFEYGIRKALNFGHTIGHAIESYFLETKTPLLHGEAIAAGMICESWLSARETGLSAKALIEISALIKRMYGKAEIPVGAFEKLIDLMRNDKKNRGKEINFTLLNKIGLAQVDCTVSENLIRQSLIYYNEL